jgi:hypothetical protein
VRSVFSRRESSMMRRVVLLGLLVSVVLAVVSAGASVAFAAGDANSASCTAETEASPGFRPYMSDCRAFELVTPPYKEGGLVVSAPAFVAADGSRVDVGVGGAFGGAGNYRFSPVANVDTVVYEFVRGAGGWQSSVLTPAATEYQASGLMAVAGGDFGVSLWGAEHSGLPNHEDVYLRSGPGASEFHPVGPGTPRNAQGEQILAGEELEPTEELRLVGASRDLTHSLFAIKSEAKGGLSTLWPGDTTTVGSQPQFSLYEYVYSGVEDREPVLVGVRNEGRLHGSPHVNEGAELISTCGTEVGSGSSGSAYNAVSSDGQVVFFTALACGAAPVVSELYARVGGEHTVAVSEPVLPGGVTGACAVSEPCHEAAKKEGVFQGASEDGSRVFFLSEQPLVNGAPAEGMKLYEERLQGTGVVEVTDVSNQGVSGVNPEVQGVARVSEDGERVYFVAKGVLAGGDRVAGREPGEAEPVGGADNLYVYEPEPGHAGVYRTVFVATLLRPGEEAALQAEEAAEQEGIKRQAENMAGAEATEIVRRFLAGEINEEQFGELFKDALEHERAFIQATTGTRGPAGTLGEDHNVWGRVDGRHVQATPDGGFLVFASSARLTPGDTSTVQQLFEFDAATGSLVRVSVGAGGPASGNADTYADAPQLPARNFASVDLPAGNGAGLAVSEDGSRVFFTSAASLAPLAQPGATNVYEYSGGRTSMISGGEDASLENRSSSVSLLGVDPSGRDAFFTTVSQLVPQAADTGPGLYDAREGGGFPAPVLEAGCVGETCRGPSGAAAVSQVPGSAGQAGGGNVVPVPLSVRPAAVKRKRSTRGALARALLACRRERGRARLVCERRARQRYGASAAGSTTSRKRGK